MNETAALGSGTAVRCRTRRRAGGAVPSQLARGKPDLQMRCALGVSSILLVAVLDEIGLDQVSVSFCEDFAQV
jgi:hypothetical protein